MSVPRFPRLVICPAILLAICIEATDVSAGELHLRSDTNSTSIVARVKQEELVGSEAVRRTYIRFGTNEFAFIVPSGFRVDATNPRKVVMASDDPFRCFIILRITEGADMSADSSRKAMLEEYHGAKVLEEGFANAMSRRVPSLNFEWKDPSGVQKSGRMAFIPFSGGVLQFSMTTDRNNMSQGLDCFHSVMLSLCGSEAGQLRVPRLSNKL